MIKAPRSALSASFRLALLAAPVAASVLVGTAGLSRAEDKRASPHEQVSAVLGGKKVTIDYGRPFKKGRQVFGGAGALVPGGQVWRTGADEATVLTTEGDLTIGTLRVPAGSYALFTVPGDKEWTLVVNKVAKQWGAFKYDAKQDLGRTAMKVAATAAPVEQFTIAIETQGDKQGTLKLSWDKVVATVPLAPAGR
ncbi:MAG: DUF2911 domain-containing protein [Polyangia bacterium]